ncbi:MAG: chorismate-binding protein [Halothiobacillaceae bacterium]
MRVVQFVWLWRYEWHFGFPARVMPSAKATRRVLQRVNQAVDFIALQRAYPARYPHFLASSAHGTAQGRYDILLAFPQSRLSFDGQHCTQDGQPIAGEFLQALDACWQAERTPELSTEETAGLPFHGGWFFYLGYELAHALEPTVAMRKGQSTRALPIAYAERCPAALIFDHLEQATWWVEEGDRPSLWAQCAEDIAQLEGDSPARNALPPLEKGGQGGFDERKALQDGQIPLIPPFSKGEVNPNTARYTRAVPLDPPFPKGEANLSAKGEVTLPAFELNEDDADAFLCGVERIREYIFAGDIFQANLSRAWRGRFASAPEPAALFRQLAHNNPGPFAALCHIDGQAIVSSSPERLVLSRHGVIETRPIAGTRRRGADADEDAALKAELIIHPKERAEHIMLLDLERNDLGRVAKPGTVQVDECMVIESYRHVHHIVSNVRAELRHEVTPGQVLAALFPGGTITGCPKVRCMQILAELEDVPREAYTGTLGYLNRDGSMDSNILIRTLKLNGADFVLRAGAGIVADSVAADELLETRAKARGLLRALGLSAS